ncbi:S-layer homology domain-containing protein [Paenibacillus sp. GXUN7292]|uniref:S-layer homology domain-containing protein n=1 Tax=Paenibacillus sp. GXUN7292 TaxID=3422499 RepID=UPI003D7E81A8
MLVMIDKRWTKQTRKLLICALIVVFGITSFTPLLPKEMVRAASDPVVPLLFSPPEVLGTMASSPVTNSAVYAMEDGKPVMYTTVTGGSDIPATFSVIDMTDYSLIRTIPLEGGKGAADGHIIDSRGNVYVIAGNGLFRYVPGSATAERLASISGASALYGLAIDENDTIYGGTYPTGSVFKYDTRSDELTVFPRLSAGKEYVKSIAYYDGTLYAGTGAIGELWKLNPETGEGEQIPFPKTSTYSVPSEVKQLYTLSIAGSLMFILTSNQNLLIYDLEKQDWYEGWSTDEQHKQYYRGMYVSPPMDDKVYLNMNREFYSFDLNTGEMEATGIPYEQYVRGAGWVELGNEDGDMPGKSLATLYNGGIVLINFKTKNKKVYEPIVPGQAVSIQSLEYGPDGLLYGAGYLGAFGSSYNTQTGEKKEFNMGQAEGMIPYNGKMMFGVYSGAYMYGMDPELPNKNGENPKLIHIIGGNEDRPFALATGDNKLFVGTVPKMGSLGGALSIYDGTSWEKYENLIHNQSIMSLAYQEETGLLYGSTTVWGGISTEPTESYAKIFIWDVAESKLVDEFVPGIAQQNNIGPKTIGALSFGADGLLWGAAYGTLFAMDPDTHQIVKQKEIHPTNWAFSHSWVPAKLRWGDDGFLYTTLGGVLTVVDPLTMAHTVIPGTKTNLMVVGKDKDEPEKTAIYYNEASLLKKITVTPGAPPIQMDVEIPIVNSGFEQLNKDNTIPGWNSFGSVTGLAEFEVSAEKTKSGAGSLKITDTSDKAESGVISIPFPVQPGLEYKAKSDVFLEAGRGAIFAMKYYDAEGKEVTPSPAPAQYIEGPKGTWLEAEFKSIAPVNAVTGKLVLFVSQAWTGTVYFDNIHLHEGRIAEPPFEGESTQSLDVQNAGFEQPLRKDGSISGWSIQNPDSLIDKDAEINLSDNLVKAGDQSLYLYDNDTKLTVAIESDLIPVIAGRTYRLSADFYRTDPPEGRSSNRPTLQVRYYDEDKKLINPSGSGTTMSKEITTPLKVWSNEGFESKAQPNAKYMKLIFISAEAWVSSVYVDNVTATTVVQSNEAVSAKLQRAAATSMIDGDNAVFTMTATADSDIIVKNGFDTVAIAKGEGNDTPVTVVIPAPSTGTHHYEVYANMPGIGRSNSIMLPPVTVYELNNYVLNTGEQLTLKVGDTFPVYARAQFGPLTKDVTSDLSIRSLTTGLVSITKNVVAARSQGEAQLEVVIGDRVIPLSVKVEASGGTSPGGETPTDPGGSTGPTDPTEPTDPTDPANPENPKEPVDPKPTEPIVFKDLASGHWAFPSIQYLVKKGLLNGYPDGSFKPDLAMKRSEVTAMLVRMLGLHLAEGSTFDDVSDSHWAKPYIEAAFSNGLVQGNGDGKFAPDQSITREQMVVLIVRALGLTGEGTALTFTDSNKTASWATASLRLAVEHGIIEGYPDGSFRPDAVLTRAAASAMMEKVLSMK